MLFLCARFLGINLNSFLTYCLIKMKNIESSQLLHKQEQESYGSNVNPFEEEIQLGRQKKKNKKISKQKKEKESKKEKKDKKKKQKQRKQRGFQSQQDEASLNSMFDEEAESGEEEDEVDPDVEDGFEQEDSIIKELYKRPNATQKLLMTLEGKNQRQINAQYSRRAKVMRQGEQLYPNSQDPRVFVVQVKPRAEDFLVLCILNKASYYAKYKQRMKIVSVIALKKKYPSRILVEAYSAGDVYEDLVGFNDIYLGKKIVEIQRENYLDLLTKTEEKKQIQWKPDTFARIRIGLYEGDLARIMKVKKNSADVLLVPRINVQQIILKIQKQSKDKNLETKQKDELLNMFINPKQKNYKERPAKRLLNEKDLQSLRQLCPGNNIKLGPNGLIILNYTFEQLDDVYGSYLPIEVMPFFSEGNFIDEMKGQVQKLTTKINFQKGEQVQIIAGDLEKHHGILIDIRQNVGVMKCLDKDLRGQILQQPLNNIAKRFKQGQKVKITSGIDGGKSGIVLKVQSKQVQVLTSNQTSIKVSKRNLENFNDENICKENVHNLKRYDLIKTNKNVVGVVLSTSKQNIRIIDTNSVVQFISNMDFDQKITVRNLVAQNEQGDSIGQESIVLIQEGANRNKKCRVIRVYKQNLFLFNDCFKLTGSLTVQLADNCSLVVKNETRQRAYISTKEIASTPNNNQFVQEEEKQVRVGQAFILKSGPLKGYQGIVKSITKDKIEVRIASKAITEWVPLQSIKKKPESFEDRGRTPNRYDDYMGRSQRMDEENMD